MNYGKTKVEDSDDGDEGEFDVLTPTRNLDHTPPLLLINMDQVRNLTFSMESFSSNNSILIGCHFKRKNFVGLKTV